MFISTSVLDGSNTLRPFCCVVLRSCKRAACGSPSITVVEGSEVTFSLLRRAMVRFVRIGKVQDRSLSSSDSLVKDPECRNSVCRLLDNDLEPRLSISRQVDAASTSSVAFCTIPSSVHMLVQGFMTCIQCGYCRWLM